MSEPITRGQPDWGKSAERTLISVGGSDLEIASRANWPMAHVPTGEIHFYDGFESSVLHWANAVSGTGSEISLARHFANSGEQSLLMTLGPASGRYCTVGRSIQAKVDPVIGINWWMAPGSPDYEPSLFVTTNFSGVATDFKVILRMSTGRILVWDDNYDEVDIGAASFSGTNFTDFALARLVLDAENGTYKSFELGGNKLEYTGPGADTGALGQSDYIYLEFTGLNKVAYTRYLYIDDVIITRNEP